MTTSIFPIHLKALAGKATEWFNNPDTSPPRVDRVLPSFVMLPPPPVPVSAEYGQVEAVEIRRQMRQGGQRPVLCRCDDGAEYVVKPFSSGGSWPLILEWICARLGRAMRLPIPNYRLVLVSEDFAEAWNVTGGRTLEPGIGFGSQFVSSAVECDEVLIKKLDPEAKTQLIAFDWWIRNTDRIHKNPNLLWDHGQHAHFLIDHEKAANTGDSLTFWQDHLAAKHMPWMTPAIIESMKRAALLLPEIQREMPSEWTMNTDGLDWFVTQLTQSISDTPTKEWRTNE